MTAGEMLRRLETDADANAMPRRFDAAPFGVVLVFPVAGRLYTVNGCAVSREEALRYIEVRYIEGARAHG